MGTETWSRSLDEKGHRQALHPTEVKGRWQKRRLWVQSFLILFFLGLPWITIGGRPALLLNLAEGKFSVFGILFRAHDVPLIFLFVMGFVLLVGLATALYGRVWCGWACPQTVFIERVFRTVERWFEGDAYERRKAERLPMTAGRAMRIAGKWSVYVVVTLGITHSVLALFFGPERLAEMIARGPSSAPGAFLFMFVSSAILLFDFGWFREQFCIVVCPYGRIQSVFQDVRTKTIAYDSKRGEPRGALRKRTSEKGDCVACNRCVQVCPTGIDIRNGPAQLECIACTACVDACDDVMVKIKKPLGLIRYASSEELEGRSYLTVHQNLFSGRNLAYAAGLLAVIATVFGISRNRHLAMVEIFKNRGAPYVVSEVEKGEMTFSNVFITEIASRSIEPLRVRFEFAEESGAQLVMPNNPVRLPEGKMLRQPFTVRFPKRILREGKRAVRMRVRVDADGEDLGSPRSEIQEKEITLIGPY